MKAFSFKHYGARPEPPTTGWAGENAGEGIADEFEDLQPQGRGGEI